MLQYLLHSLSVAAIHDAWAPLRTGLESWTALQLGGEFAVNVGDVNGTIFTWESPGFSMTKTRMAGASLSKWPAAIMLTGLVNDGTMRFDDRVNKYLSWWSTDQNDPRSRITLRHLLSFTSGYSTDGFVPPWVKCDGFMECARALYKHSSQHTEEPGTKWAYLSCHLQFAGAMAVAASGSDIQALFKKYLYQPFNMTRTTWTPLLDPQLATGITTTGDDFEQLLRRLLSYEVLPKGILDQMETDYSQPPVEPSGDGWFGHYGMGHWWECIGYGTPLVPYERRALPRVCMDSHIQAGPGMFGYYPLIDRSGGGGAAGAARPPYYFQIALQESFALSGIPEYLRLMAKPVADVIMSGQDPGSYPRRLLLQQGGGLLARDLQDIQASLGACRCQHKPHAHDEPYAALGARLSADEPKRTRRELTNLTGEGCLLSDLSLAHSALGKCSCSGRKGTGQVAEQ